MENNQKNKTRRRLKSVEKDLRILFRDIYDPIPNAPEDEYDSIIHQLISQLNKSTQVNDIAKFLIEEFAQNWELVISQDKAAQLSTAFVNWKNSKNSAASANAG